MLSDEKFVITFLIALLCIEERRLILLEYVCPKTEEQYKKWGCI